MATSRRSQGSGAGTGDTDDGEDEEESSSSLQPIFVDDDGVDVDKVRQAAMEDITGDENSLVQFRSQWELELKGRSAKPLNEQNSQGGGSSEQSREGSVERPVDSVFERARVLFMQGIQNEQNGSMHEAVRFYRQSMQLVPDIERKLFNVRRAGTYSGRGSFGAVVTSGETGDGPLDLTVEEMLQRFADRLVDGGKRVYCRMERVQESGHMTFLPAEVLFYIVKFAISDQIDMRVLEELSLVCCGFYALAREPELWHLACVRTWGIRTVLPDAVTYPTWREMYVNRPHVWHNGVYISKVTYVRHGEASFQDSSYRPWHLVVYYRYLRFFADGTILFLTTSDEPGSIVAQLRTKSTARALAGVLVGTYRLVGPDALTATVRRAKPEDGHQPHLVGYPSVTYGSRSRRQQIVPAEIYEPTYTIELKINHARRRRNFQLTWQSYEVVVRAKLSGIETLTSFDLADQSFQAFYFSRVRSFVAASQQPLE